MCRLSGWLTGLLPGRHLSSGYEFRCFIVGVLDFQAQGGIHCSLFLEAAAIIAAHEADTDDTQSGVE